MNRERRVTGEPLDERPAVVAIGGGHGLAASLRALRRVAGDLTAVVGVGDDGGSSGRLRDQFGLLPPGDLRMALSALCGDDTWGRTWSRVVQHRFGGDGDLRGHALGNLLIAALWEETGDVVAGLDWVGSLLDTHGRVLPAATVPVEVIADVAFGTDDGETVEVRGQSAVAGTEGRVVGFRIDPPAPPVCTQAIEAMAEADVITLGPGSWFTSVMTPLLIPDLRQAFERAQAQRVLVLNLAPQPGETSDFAPETHLEVLHLHFPEVRFDDVIADPSMVPDREALQRAAREIGADVMWTPLLQAWDPQRHDVDLLASAFSRVIGHGSISAWQ